MKFSATETILMLSGDTTIAPGFLTESKELMRMIRNGDDYEVLLKYCNQNW